MGRETGEETRSIWMATPLPRFAALDGDRQVDVAVIGAGITGITTAWLLQRRGRRVAVIEAAEVGSGETSRTSAHLTAVLDGGLSRLVSRFGGDNAIVAVRAHQAAIDWIDTTARTLGIDCDFRRVPGFLYCDDEICRPDGENGRALLDAELEAAQALGLEVRRVPSAPLPFPTGPALRFGNQAQMHPRRYLRGLVDALVSDGSVVFDRTRVLSVEDGEPCRVETERGTITANAVVVASHVPVINKLFLHTKLEPMRSYLLAISTGQPHPDGLFWDLARPYHYWRSVRIDGQDLMLVGGDDHKVGETEDTEGAFRDLEAYVRQRLGRAMVAARWSGQIIEPVDGLAYVGRNSMSTHVFVATGYAGNGLTGATARGHDPVRRGRGIGASLERPVRRHPGEAGGECPGVRPPERQRRPPPGGRSVPDADPGRGGRSTGRRRSGGGVQGRAARGLSRAHGGAAGAERRVHPPRLPGRLEQRRAVLGLPLSRQPLRARRGGDQRTGREGAGAAGPGHAAGGGIGARQSARVGR